MITARLTCCFPRLFLVLQAEVYPCLLLKDRRKFHIRTYLVILEMLYGEDILEAFIFNRHEVRIAGEPVPEDDTTRDREIHITNGAVTKSTERVLLDELEEFKDRNLQARIELFVAKTFGDDLMQDIAGRVRVSAGENTSVGKFAVAGLDLMITEDNQIYLLEVNADPQAPKESSVTEHFRQHLEGFMRDLTTLVTSGRAPPTFLSADDVLDKYGG